MPLPLACLPRLALLLALASAGCRTECEEVDGPLGPGADAGDVEEVALGAATWRRHTVDASACGPAYVSIVDIDDDGAAEMIWSRLGERAGATIPSGEITLYDRDDPADLGRWSRAPILPHSAELRFPEETTLVDLDDDGDLDVIAPMGFLVCEVVPFADPCGGMLWFENRGDRWARHDILAPTAERFYHVALLTDLDLDGIDDLISVGERYDPGSAEVVWWRGTGGDVPFERRARAIGPGLGSLAKLADIDGDGDQDLYSAQYFAGGASFAWYEQVSAPTSADGDPGEWAYHVIDDTSGKSIDLRIVPDLLGDGITRAVATNHTNTANDDGDRESAVLLLTPPDDPREPWTKQAISEGIVSREGKGEGAPGILNVGDLDGDGDLDLLVSGDGDPRVFLYEQAADHTFVQHVLLTDFGQAGGLGIADLDGDGDDDFVVSGYEANTLYLFERL